MNTEVIKINSPAQKQEIKKAATLLKSGNLVALPTETVYGLGANALDENAVKSIFKAKGRPQDNPLIVHISDFEEIYDLVAEVPDSAKALAREYWPGPMTLILKKSKRIPSIVSAGLDTLAVRLPNHDVTRAIINEAGVPIAAPSANLSGSPSPTTAQSVLDDMNGKIPLIVDGGACHIGVESTVISLLNDIPSILRPGGITPDQVSSVLGSVNIDEAVFSKVDKNAVVASPGMKYKHYAPKTKVVVVKGSREKYLDFLNKQAGNIGALCFVEDVQSVNCKYVTYGKEKNSLSQSSRLFNALREADSLAVDVIYARYPFEDGMGLAVINRLLRSAAFEVIEV